jgi:hypothetical protein
MLAVLEWVAPAVTMIAAAMTAANLGPRVTGLGFAVFVAGSVSWIAIAIDTHQPNLLWTNAFLTLVNLAGVWRWLGRRARYEAGGRNAAALSKTEATPTLVSTASLPGRKLIGASGEPIAEVIDAMIRCDNGGLAYLVVKEGGVGGVGERLHALSPHEIHLGPERLCSRESGESLARRPVLSDQRWPSRAGSELVAASGSPA